MKLEKESEDALQARHPHGIRDPPAFFFRSPKDPRRIGLAISTCVAMCSLKPSAFLAVCSVEREGVVECFQGKGPQLTVLSLTQILIHLVALLLLKRGSLIRRLVTNETNHVGRVGSIFVG